MAIIPGSVRLAGFIAPTDSTDTYPVTSPIWGLGGLRTVSDISDRDAISNQRRESGMLVYVSDENKYYKLGSGLTNSDWSSIVFGEDSLSLTGGTVSGDVYITSNLSAGTIYSGSTDLYDIFLTSADLTATTISAGSNVDVQLSGNNYQISVINSPIFNNLTFSGTATGGDLFASNLSGATIYSGSTDLYDIFLTEAPASDVTRVQPGINITTGGTENEPIINLVDSPSVNNFNASGTSNFTGTIQSGGTDLYSIFLTDAPASDITRVQPGTNISTGGTENEPIINLDDNILLNSVNSSSISADTIYSGSTDLYDIFLTEADGNDITRVQGGTNISTGGTANEPTVNIVDSPSFNQITTSGSSTFAGANFTGTIQSGGTDLYSIFLTEADGNDITRVQPGDYITTGGTANEPTVNLAPNVFLTSISADTIYSGSTNLYDIFLTEADGNDITRVQPGINITTGGTENEPIINLVDSPSVNNFNASGTSNFTGTIQSGGTDLYSIFLTDAPASDITRVQPGTNISTGGTENEPIINLDDNILLNSVNSSIISGGTIYSGSTDLYDIFLTEALSADTNIANTNLTLDSNRFHNSAGFNLTFSGSGLFGFGTSIPTEKVTIGSGNIRLDNSFGVRIGTNIIDGGQGFFGPTANYIQLRTSSDYSEPWFFMNASGNTDGRFIQWALGLQSTDIGMNLQKIEANYTGISNSHFSIYDNSGIYNIGNLYQRKSAVSFLLSEGSALPTSIGSVAIAMSAVTMEDSHTLYTNKIKAHKLTLSANTEAPLNLPIINDSFSSTTHGDVWISTGITGTILNVVVGGITKSVELT